MATPSTTSTTDATTTDNPTTTVNPTDAAILAAYRGLWTDIGAVEGRYPVDPLDPILTRHAAGSERIHVGDAATILKFKGEYVAGPALDTSRAIVKHLDGDVAVVADCEYDGGILMNGRTNQVLDPAGTQRELASAEVDFMTGTWKVTEFNLVSPGCTVAS